MEDIDKNIIVKSFKKCGISCSMDGAEDDALYDDDSLEDVHEGKLIAVKLMMTLYQKKNSRRYLLAPMRVAYLEAFNNFLFFFFKFQ